MYVCHFCFTGRDAGFAGGDGTVVAHFFGGSSGDLFDVGGSGVTEVVSGLEAAAPSFAIHAGEFAHLGAGEPKVRALALVDPFLPKW